MLLFTSVLFMLGDSQWAAFSKVRLFISIPAAPFEYAVNFPAQLYEQIKLFWTSQKVLLLENQQLKAEQLQLRAMLQRLQSLESENRYLLSLNQVAKAIPEKSKIASIMAITPEFFTKQIVINLGSKEGVYLGQPVLDAYGVMGQVIQVNLFSSRVLLINDERSGLSVQDTRSGVRGIVTGAHAFEELQLHYVGHGADVKVGDIFVTSGLSNHIPQGYPVGVIKKSSNQNTASPFSDIILTPSAHLDRSRQVLLIWFNHHV